MSDNDIEGVRAVKYGRPRCSLKNANIQAALRTTLVPHIASKCSIVAIRSIFDFATHAEAVQQLAARRKQIEDTLETLEMASVFISNFASSMKSSPQIASYL